MKCEICNENEAVLHVKQIVGSDTVEFHICTSCAKVKGIAADKDKIQLSIPDLLGGLLGKDSSEKNGPCPKCGTEYEQLRKEGILGCPVCYEHFSAEIHSYLENETGYSAHNGRYPAKLEAFRAFLIDREKLKHRLKRAVDEERYELAAELRDQLNDMEREEDNQ